MTTTFEPLIPADLMKEQQAAVTKGQELLAKLANTGIVPTANPVELISNPETLPAEYREVICEAGSDVLNYTMLWESLAQEDNSPAAPSGELSERLEKDFRSLDNLLATMATAAGRRAGKGWIWLVAGRSGRLLVVTTPANDNPFMEQLTPLLGMYLPEVSNANDQKAERAAWLKAWWPRINWEVVSHRLKTAPQPA